MHRNLIGLCYGCNFGIIEHSDSIYWTENFTTIMVVWLIGRIHLKKKNLAELVLLMALNDFYVKRFIFDIIVFNTDLIFMTYTLLKLTF